MSLQNRVKLLYIQPNSETGGSDHCLLRLVRSLDLCQYEPIILLPQVGPLVAAFEQAGARVCFLPMEQLRTKLSISYQTRYIKNFWPTICRITRLIQAEQIDLVHTNSLYCLYGGWAARFAKRPHVWHVREIPPALPLVPQLLGKMVLALSTRIAAMSQACVRPLFSAKERPSPVTLLPDGIDLHEFRLSCCGQRIRGELGVSAESPLIGFVGRLDPWKGLDVFLKAAATLRKRFPDVHFLVAGGAPVGYERYEKKMRSLATTLGLDGRIHFTGWRYRHDDIPELMASLTIMSHTATRPEPFGLVLIEAMAMQRPVVAARAGGPLEIVDDTKTGYLTPPGDPEAHARAVALLLEAPARALAMGQAGRHRIEEYFSVERFRITLRDIYEQALGKNVH